MKTLWVVLLAAVAAISFGCTIGRSITPVEKNQALAEFLNQTNLVYANDTYWIKDVPSPESSLGAVYEKIDKAIKVKNEEKVYSAFRFTSGKLFGEILDANITKHTILYSTEYSYNASDSANLAVMAVFTGNVDNVIQIDKKVELKEVWTPNLTQVTANTSYCNDKSYYVSRIYLGASSDIGSQEVKYKMEVMTVYVGITSTGMEKSSLHNVKQGALAFNLEPVISLPICKAPKGLTKTPKTITIKPVPLHEIEKDLEKKKFKKLK